jgi:hypothetical protein
VVLAQAERAGADGSLLYNGWSPLGGIAQGAAAVTTWGGGHVDMFVRGGDNNLWHRSIAGWYAGSWSAWQNLGAPPGGLTSDPAAVAWSAGRIDVFVAGAGGQVWHSAYVGRWTAWQNMGGTAVGAPAVSSWAAGRLDVFVRGSDNQLWHRFYSGTWSTWQPLGGSLSAAPAAVSWGPNRIDVFVRGTDLAVWHDGYYGVWPGFQRIGGVVAYGPGVTSWGPGRLDLYVTGSDHRLYHQWFDGPNGLGSWSGWQLAQDAALTSAPVPVATKFGQIDVFGRGTDSGVWQGIGALPANQCSLSSLSISLGQVITVRNGTFVSLVNFVNTSSTACYLAGDPGVSYVDSSGNQIGASAAQSSVDDYGPVPLVPEGTAQAQVYLDDLAQAAPAGCQPATPAGIRISPPGSTASTVLPFELQVCANPALTWWSSVTHVVSPTLGLF